MGLSKELMERILSNLGFRSLGKGVTSNTLPKKLKLEEENYSISEYEVYGSECNVTSPPLKVIGSNIGTKDNPDFIVVVVQDSTTIVLKYSFKESDEGTFFTSFEDKWVDMSVLAKLNLTTATELIAQEGLFWSPSTDPDYMFSIISSILSE